MKKISFTALVSMVLSCVICSIAVNWVALPNGFVVTGITGLAIATFAMGQMPGSLQMQNIIPTQILGTALTAAPVEGVLATLFMIVVGVGYLYWQVKKGHDDPEAAIELYQVQGLSLIHI